MVEPLSHPIFFHLPYCIVVMLGWVTCRGIHGALASTSVIIGLHYCGILARLFKIRFHLLREVSIRAVWCQCLCCIEHCFAQDVVQSVRVHLGFGGVERSIFFPANELSVGARGVIAAPSLTPSEKLVADDLHAEQQQRGGFFWTLHPPHIGRSWQW